MRATIPELCFWEEDTQRDPLKPDLSIHSQANICQIDQSVTKGGSGMRHFSIGQSVIAQNYSGHSKWVPGTINTLLGSLSSEVEIEPNLIWRQHTEQLNVVMFLLHTICQIPTLCHLRP